jgi:hypothetical protein
MSEYVTDEHMEYTNIIKITINNETYTYLIVMEDDGSYKSE